ncbi:MAG: hypothetical protein AAF629_05270 [Chloroflexota bacterium]
MRRRTQQKLILISQIATIVGIVLAALWNSGSVLFDLPNLGYTSLLAPLPGGILWGLALVAPRLMALSSSPEENSYRLVYSSEADWSDEIARQALFNLAQTLGGLVIIWARDGQGIGCWLTVPHSDEVLQRLVAETFPNGHLEKDQPPECGVGCVILRTKTDLLNPDRLCERPGIDGVCYRWLSEETAVVSIWGSQAEMISCEYARKRDCLLETGSSLQSPPYVGQNPWPQLPSFPPSPAHSGLAAISHLSLTEPTLRVSYPALTLGEDEEGQSVGFGLPDLTEAQEVQVIGQHTVQVTSDLAYQAIREQIPVFLLDGEGTVIRHLSKHLSREIATGRILTCDLERPAQSRFRLNPFWLPNETAAWPVVTTLWRYWLRSLGVTVGGLGQTAYRHTQLAVILTALAARERELEMDPTGLSEALAQPDFLTQVESELAKTLFDEPTWQWWQTEGRSAPRFDVHQRLGHLRERLTRLLTIPQYQVLWQAPYLDLADSLAQHQSLFWRFAGENTQFQPFMQGQLLALINALNTKKRSSPVLVILHHWSCQDWLQPLSTLACVRLIISQKDLATWPSQVSPTTRVISRLDRESANNISLAQLRPTDLRRLPPGQLIVQRNKRIGTVTMEAFS